MFTARYALSPDIKQIRFVFKVSINKNYSILILINLENFAS
jgi:hypothetical protein